jgi:hypothetical protein
VSDTEINSKNRSAKHNNLSRSGKRVTKSNNDVLFEEYIAAFITNVSIESGNQKMQMTQQPG